MKQRYHDNVPLSDLEYIHMKVRIAIIKVFLPEKYKSIQK